jgi:hypothetical protein
MTMTAAMQVEILDDLLETERKIIRRLEKPLVKKSWKKKLMEKIYTKKISKAENDGKEQVEETNNERPGMTEEFIEKEIAKLQAEKTEYFKKFRDLIKESERKKREATIEAQEESSKNLFISRTSSPETVKKASYPPPPPPPPFNKYYSNSSSNKYYRSNNYSIGYRKDFYYQKDGVESGGNGGVIGPSTFSSFKHNHYRSTMKNTAEGYKPYSRTPGQSQQLHTQHPYTTFISASKQYKSEYSKPSFRSTSTDDVSRSFYPTESNRSFHRTNVSTPSTTTADQQTHGNNNEQKVVTPGGGRPSWPPRTDNYNSSRYDRYNKGNNSNKRRE